MAIIYAILAGICTSLEAFINSELEKNTTALVATFISLLVGSLIFLFFIVISNDLKSLTSINSVNPILLIGGILGGFIVYFTVKSVANLGLSSTLTLIVISQMLVGFFIDIIVFKQATHLYKYIGAILLFIGTFFILS